jgi:methanogenic corrinoid protein MtbC1
MKRAKLEEMATSNLIELFVKIAVEQDNALLVGQTAKFNRLYDRMKEVSDELKARPGDQRRALMTLYEYPNMQVRLKAAIHTLAVAPVEARQAVEAIANSKWFPQAGDAGMSLHGLDSGTFKPT